MEEKKECGRKGKRNLVNEKNDSRKKEKKNNLTREEFDGLAFYGLSTFW